MKRKPKISENPVNEETLNSIKGCASDALSVLKPAERIGPAEIVEAVDAFIFHWQKKKKPPGKIFPNDKQEAELVFGSLWGEQLVAAYQWEWVFTVDHEHDDVTALAVVAPDRSLAVYPTYFIRGCLANKNVDCTIALAFNMLAPPASVKEKPRVYSNMMARVQRFVPRV